MELEVFKSRFNLGTKILVTGHTGFKGVWLTLLLEKLGHEVGGLSLEAETGSLYKRLNRINKIEEKFIDIRDFNAVSQSIPALKPNLIFKPEKRLEYEDKEQINRDMAKRKLNTMLFGNPGGPREDSWMPELEQTPVSRIHGVAFNPNPTNMMESCSPYFI
jgi:hypothetical protein